jgi:hypothetical protein
MSIFARVRRWFRGPLADPVTQRDADAIAERRDMIRIWQGDSPADKVGTMPMPPRKSD